MSRRPALLLMALLVAGSASAENAHVGDLHISQPWSRALPPVSPNGAAYMVIENTGPEADALIGASTPVAARAEIHQHVHTDGVMRMVRVEEAAIEADSQVTFEPGNHHIMLFDLNRPLRAGEAYPLTLHFKQAGDVEIQVQVQQDAPQGGSATQHSGHSSTGAAHHH